MSETVAFSVTTPPAELGADAAYWREVANGGGGADWLARVPDTVRAATIGQIEALQATGAKFQDVTRSVALSGDAVVFAATARRA